MTRSCEEMARVIRQIAKRAFGKMLNHYIGSSPMVLVGEGPGGEDIQMRADDKWLEENQVTRLGVTIEDAPMMMNHVQRCAHAACVVAKARLDLAEKLFSKGFPPGVALASVFNNHHGEPFRLVRADGFGDDIDILKLFAPWFLENEFSPRVTANRRGLIVEDMSHWAGLIMSILTDEEYDVVGIATNRAEALRMFTELRPDFVTMDNRLPNGEKGLEIAAAIRALDANVLILMVTTDLVEFEGREAVSKVKPDEKLLSYLKEVFSK